MVTSRRLSRGQAGFGAARAVSDYCASGPTARNGFVWDVLAAVEWIALVVFLGVVAKAVHWTLKDTWKDEAEPMSNINPKTKEGG